ncbi:hypothetical protein GobsT_23940 [Gemmata obscuriglobus]|nr:DUF1501 domain-containing protein [Gemmata obscuriglobus]QEG27635.1 hypothetical protein GobsT_23940 [Gemmata obscuriglobus]VTS04793.1 secreted protein containing duf1501 : Uncharacterized protein OS=Singulisphaera acidiphila (strain ATCC BAA-1392 / DSM 18658 / VKM B-2454 / MOB10) GN=Sinac_0432 PE=4 SV=1: DUF1501 [Gemmata obscuriglobus UQM 2246]
MTDDLTFLRRVTLDTVGFVPTAEEVAAFLGEPAAARRGTRSTACWPTRGVRGTEFGRPAEFDGGRGRGHQGTCFSLLLAGGGLKHCGACGVTDDLAKKIVERPVPVPDCHATICAVLGIDPAKALAGGPRPVPITDDGKPIAALFG